MTTTRLPAVLATILLAGFLLACGGGPSSGSSPPSKGFKCVRSTPFLEWTTYQGGIERNGVTTLAVRADTRGRQTKESDLEDLGSTFIYDDGKTVEQVGEQPDNLVNPGPRTIPSVHTPASFERALVSPPTQSGDCEPWTIDPAFLLPPT